MKDKIITGSVDKYTVKGSSRPMWRYRISKGKDLVTGERLRETCRGFAKEAEARDAMRVRIEEILKERNAPPTAARTAATPEEIGGSIKLSTWITRWINEYAVVDCARTTVFRYKQLAGYITNAQAPEIVLIAQEKIRDLAKRHGAIETAMYALLRQKAQRRAHLSPRSVKHVADLLRVALNKAFRLDYIDVNPMLKVELPKIAKKKAISLKEDQFRVLRKVCRLDPMEFAYVEVISALGGRRGEGLALTWPDFDKGTGRVTVSKSLAQTPDDGIFIKATKEEEIHEVQLSPSAIAALEIWRAVQAEHKQKLGKDYKDQGLIFAEADGSFLNPAYISQKIKRRMKKAGITVGSLHSLRHTNATLLRHKGVPVETVSVRLGHSDVSTTQDIYSHAVAEDDQRAADEWEKILQAADAWEGVTPKGAVQ